MNIKVGIDLTHIPKFEKAVKRSGDTFLNRVFHPSELERKDIPHLAGVFAAKEAITKTGVVPVGGWKKIEIVYEESGRPKVNILDQDVASKIEKLDISISHDGNYALSSAVVVLK